MCSDKQTVVDNAVLTQILTQLQSLQVSNQALQAQVRHFTPLLSTHAG